MNVLSLIFVIQVVTQFAKCQGGGGPSTFGYDASSACSRPYSRAGRARLANLPCDFRRQNWCTVAGNSYPWHAVRRFVQENQGLMRRMYGDESYINVLRAEFDKNEIELKYDDYYYHPFDDDHRRYQYVDEYDDYQEDHEDPKSSNSETSGRGFTSRSLNDPSTKRIHKFPKLSEYTRPHFRPTEKTTTTAKKPTTTKPTTKPTTTVSTTTSTISSSTNTETPPTTSSASLASSTTVLTTQESTTKQLPTSTTNENQTESSSTEEIPVATVAAVSEIAKEQNFSINEIPGQIDRIDEDFDETVTNQAVTEEILEELTTETLPGMTDEGLDTVVEDDLFGSGKETTIHETYSTSEQQFRPRPEYKPGNRPQTSSIEGQLYQDVAAKDQQEQPVLKLRGVNACPVKEEVVAPFWANNTRGEVLALLNLYPFEQYVHWEKCTHENKQMYCRDGCRCEQQYRLHRLLAYDPNNECRGIFSDWFKFPSCCVCRCYDLPLEFRVTSRSPRAQRPKIKVRLPRNRFS